MKAQDTKVAKAIESFHADLKLCLDMQDKQFAVRRLAQRIGSDKANEIARRAGLSNAYYWA